MPGFVGVDAGGSKTTAAYARDETVVRAHSGEAANPRVRGVEAAADAIAAAVAGALAGERADALAVGAAGAGSPAMCDALALALAKRFPGTRIGVSDDAHIALRAVVPHGNGIVLVAGTGALAYAEIAEQRLRAGGYGYLLGEEGSGFAMGAAALRRLLHAFDGRVKSDALLDALRERLRARAAQDVVAAVYERAMPVGEIAACAPLVLEHAARGVRSATLIVQDAAKALFELLRAIVASLEEKDVPLAFSGGLLRENNLLTYLLDLRIANEFPHLAPIKGGAEPYLGALADARRLAAQP